MKIRQMACLVSHHFRVMDIATMCDCSTRTIQRRMRGFGMDSNPLNEICDAHLNERVGEIVVQGRWHCLAERTSEATFSLC